MMPRTILVWSERELGLQERTYPGFTFIRVKTLEELKQTLVHQAVFLLVLSLKHQAVNISITLSEHYNLPVLLFVQEENLDQAIYLSSDYFIFVLSENVEPLMIEQALSLLFRLQKQREELLDRIEKEKQKRNEEKLIAQAKYKLIEVYNYSEESAHRYIQKKAMDTAMSKAAIARMLLDKLG